MDDTRSRSQLLLDIEHDLNRISKRLHALEDHFENDGIIMQIADAIHQLTVEIESMKARQVGDASAE